MNGRGAVAWTIDQELRMLKSKGNITYSNIYQRSYVWDKERECLLVASLIEGYDVPAVTASKHTVFTDGASKPKAIYDLLNGKQRFTALRRITEDKVKFEGLRLLRLLPEDSITFTDEEKTFLKYEIKNIDGIDYEVIDINGLSFSELPEILRKVILGRVIRIEFYENMTRAEERQTIINANCGKGMTATERMRVEMHSFEQILRLSAHPVFRLALTEKGIAGYLNEKLVEQIYAMLYMEKPSLELKVFRPVIVNADITQEQEEEILNILDRLMGVYEIVYKRNPKIAKQRILGKTHMVSMAPFVLRSIKENVPIERLADWMEYFFSGSRRASISNIYNETTSRNTAQRGALDIRTKEITSYYEKYITKNEAIPVVASTKRTTTKKKNEIRTVVTGAAEENKEQPGDSDAGASEGVIKTVVIAEDGADSQSEVESIEEDVKDGSVEGEFTEATEGNKEQPGDSDAGASEGVIKTVINAQDGTDSQSEAENIVEDAKNSSVEGELGEEKATEDGSDEIVTEDFQDPA